MQLQLRFAAYQLFLRHTLKIINYTSFSLQNFFGCGDWVLNHILGGMVTKMPHTAYCMGCMVLELGVVVCVSCIVLKLLFVKGVVFGSCGV